MKTFFEHFLDEVLRRQETREIDNEKARCWVTEIQTQLLEYAQHHPDAPIVQMPVRH